jgi:uncharacterized RDD family membrane protein YckC
MTSHWYYARDGKREGPISQEEMQRLIDATALSADTPIWSEQLSQWTAVKDVSVFRLPAMIPPPPPPLSPPPLPPSDAVHDSTSPGRELPAAANFEARPWVRYWARYVDMGFGGFLVGIAWVAFGLDTAKFEAVFVLSVAFAWVFVESTLLSSWGTTPGKWLLKTTVREPDGNRLTFTRALSRSFSVWWRGMGIGFPLATLFTCLVAYNKLSNGGSTTWDREGHFQVRHQRIGPLRVIVTVLFLLAIFILAVWDKASTTTY